MRLACWNADGVRGRKFELEHFLSQHGVDICLLSETFLNPGQAFRLANYVCHRRDRPTTGCGTAILVRRGIVHHSVPVPGLTHLEATAIQVTLAGKSVLNLAAFLSPSRPLIVADLTACFGGGLPVLMAGDLNAKHVDWKSRLNTRRRKLLRDYADGNSCLIFGPDFPTTNPFNPLVNTDVLNIVITKNLSFPVHLISCSALSSDHLQVIIDTSCRSSFHNLPDRPDFRRTDWASFQTQLEELIPFDSDVMGMLGPLLNRRSDLSVRNGVLLYKQLIRPLMDYAWPAWRSVARSHVRRLQVLQSKCLRLAIGAHWYVSNRQIHEDLGVPLLADHLRPLTASFDSKLAEVRNPVVRQLGRYLSFPRFGLVA